MKTRLILALTAVLALALAIAPATLRTQHVSATVRSGLSLPGLKGIQRQILSGFASFEAGIGVPAHPARARPSSRMAKAGLSLCPSDIRANVVVNQNCLNISDPDLQGRGQAQDETAISQNPLNPNQLVAGYNDYRRGDGTCGSSFSGDGGATWADSTLPNGFTRGTNFGGVARQYWQGGGDTSVAWDSQGNAYMACQVFQRGPSTTNNPDQSSAVYVYRSTGDAGASWNFTGHPAVESFVTAASGLPFNDKPYMTIDNHPGSPFRDRIYVTWTLFGADGTSYIMGVHSDDFGQTFSSPVVVSTDSPSLCTNTRGRPTPFGSCNVNQFSDPFTGPDGTLYVAFNNFNSTNTGSENHNHVLLVRSTDGGQTFSSPVLVSNYYELPDCATYQGQDAGRACVPEKGTAQNSVFRATNYPSGAVNPTNPQQVVVTFGSYINQDSNESNGCAPAGFSPTTGGRLYTGVKTAGACSNKILLSVSNDGGQTFTGTTTDPRNLPVVTTAAGQATTDQWWEWTTFTPTGTLVTSYYDRQYGSDETTGTMDTSVSTSSDLSSFQVMRATSTSMPLPTQFPDTQGNSLFAGDYSGLTAVSEIHPLWMDTRTPDAFLCPGTPPAVCAGTEPNGFTANDQTVYTDTLSAP